MTLFVDVFQVRQIAAGAQPARRPVFRRTHGIAHATSRSCRGYPTSCESACSRASPRTQHGCASPATCRSAYPIAAAPSASASSCSGDGGDTYDFVLQNHDVFFVDTARDMCEFTCLTLNGRGEEYLAAHPVTKQILDDMEKDVDSVLATTMWSVLPSRLGDKLHAKYKLAPDSVPPASWAPDKDDPFFLRDDLQSGLRSGEARWRFYVQCAPDDNRTPLDRATVRWTEQDSPPVPASAAASS